MRSSVIGRSPKVGPHAVFSGLPRVRRRLRWRARVVLATIWLANAGLLGGLWFVTGWWWLSAGLVVFWLLMTVRILHRGLRSGRVFLRADGIHPVTARTQPTLNALVEDVSSRMGVRPPPAWVLEDRQPNAFAMPTGWRTRAIVFTTGWLETSTAYQTRGVIAHELAHVLNRDTTLRIVLDASSNAAWLGKRRSPDPYAYRKPSGFAAVKQSFDVLLGVVRVSLVMVTAMVSRSRESLADLTAAEALGGPQAMIASMRHILDIEQAQRQGYAQQRSRARTATSSHPYTRKRIRLLLRACEQQASVLPSDASTRSPASPASSPPLLPAMTPRP